MSFYGQSLIRLENDYILKLEKEKSQQQIDLADSFLQQSIGKDYFERYFHFQDQFQYDLNNHIEKLIAFVGDSKVTNIITRYTLTIPEIKYRDNVYVICDKQTNTWHIEDSSRIPNFILHGLPLDLLDTSAIRKLLLKQGIAKTKLEIENCFYDQGWSRFIWIAREFLDSNVESNNKAIYNVKAFKIDAITGQLLEEKKTQLKTLQVEDR